MNALTEARDDVEAALKTIAGLQVFDHLPERLSPPSAVVLPGQPYVTPGQVIGEYQIQLAVTVMTKRGTNEVVSKGLDELIVNVLSALKGFGYASVARPYVDNTYEGADYLAATITITTIYEGGN